MITTLKDGASPVRLGWIALFLALMTLPACGGDDDATGQAALEQMGGDIAADEHAEGDEYAGEEGRVELTEAALAGAGILVSEVPTRELPAGPPLGDAVPGQVAFDPARVALVSPRSAGRIERLEAVEGDEVRAGQSLAQVLSPAFLTAQNDYLHAARRARQLQGTADEDGAQALVDAARRRLSLLGAEDTLIEGLASGREPLDLIPIRAPFAGSIVEAHTLAGAAVEPGSPIFTLADLSVVTVVAEVPERALGSLHRGQRALIELSAYPDTVVEGTVERIREELDPSTRTARAIVRVPNGRRLLRPGMFALVRLATAAEEELVVRPVLPAQAVITEGDERYVFVEVAPRTFERRDVEATPLGNDEVVIVAGLESGERVVVEGAFTLKSELAEGEFGGHH